MEKKEAVVETDNIISICPGDHQLQGTLKIAILGVFDMIQEQAEHFFVVTSTKVRSGEISCENGDFLLACTLVRCVPHPESLQM